MAENWRADQLEVYKDIKEEGFPVTVRTLGSPGTFNPTTLVYDGAVAPSDVVTYGLMKNFALRQVDGALIERDDKRLLLPAYGIGEVTPDHQILIDGVVQNVIHVQTISPANIPILHDLQVRN